MSLFPLLNINQLQLFGNCRQPESNWNGLLTLLQVIECSCRDNINIDNIFKAYLSLAKVSLSTAVSVNLKSRTSGAGTTSSRTLSPTEQTAPTTTTTTTTTKTTETSEEWWVSIVTDQQINNTCTFLLFQTGTTSELPVKQPRWSKYIIYKLTLIYTSTSSFPRPNTTTLTTTTTATTPMHN